MPVDHLRVDLPFHLRKHTLRHVSEAALVDLVIRKESETVHIITV